jgi:hypothetical protein
MRFEHQCGELVYLKTDPEQNPMMVTGILIRPSNVILYMLALGSNESSHFECEVSKDKNYTSF